MQKIVPILQSRNWNFDYDMDWLMKNALFAIKLKGDGRPWVVTKQPVVPLPYLGPFNLFQIDNDRYGLTINLFAIMTWGCTSFIYPELSLWRDAR